MLELALGLRSGWRSSGANLEIKDRRVGMWGVWCIHGVGASRQYNTLWLVWKVCKLLGAWEHLREDVKLTEAAGDQMTILGSNSSR